MLPTQTELRERYASYSNNRLLFIVHNKRQYTAEALAVARAELAKRDISAADVDGFLDEQEERQLTASLLSCIPLRFWEKALFFFIWFAPWFLGGALRLNYHEEGYALKVRQTYVFSVAGFLALLLDVFAAIYFNLGNAASVALLLMSFLGFIWIEKKVGVDPPSGKAPEPESVPN